MRITEQQIAQAKHRELISKAMALQASIERLQKRLDKIEQQIKEQREILGR